MKAVPYVIYCEVNMTIQIDEKGQFINRYNVNHETTYSVNHENSINVNYENAYLLNRNEFATNKPSTSLNNDKYYNKKPNNTLNNDDIFKYYSDQNFFKTVAIYPIWTVFILAVIAFITTPIYYNSAYIVLYLAFALDLLCSLLKIKEQEKSKRIHAFLISLVVYTTSFIVCNFFEHAPYIAPYVIIMAFESSMLKKIILKKIMANRFSDKHFCNWLKRNGKW